MKDQHNALDHAPLGADTEYVNQYDASLLYPIARDLNWQAQGVERSSLPFHGCDIWNAYEVSWLNSRGKPVVRLAEFRIPADSLHIIESKSFKLYLNSFNLTRFSSESDVQSRLMDDLSAVAGGTVEVILQPVDSPAVISYFEGECLDEIDIEVVDYSPAPQRLSAAGKVIEESLYSHLLKSNCPVTGQPDWASIAIDYRGPAIDKAGLLQYLISYREHGDFHEQCVESIFMDIWQVCQPEALTVYARYLRRGGLDINPWRSSEAGQPDNLRLSRQ
ncbi:NADPH-dependent 7-cyano-7-deazaguanine reductase QueF [Amphritea sp. 1_MG-2023]|uniref:NADPH-dependent 7-cyano-7-deazaguanine reductase QueF n=1 Tax=Amphritea sp. 1_MG-2023 TaxID=3062670 RepID=UPI0026E3BBA3|nr:NADPH-dependent 7-cyano-7-deazaguanine reductase QueF [Amphritea sp. 1_MG-2023]MDO6563738.1 NADPH-dependent 7-cyano-7-deazaguanine reductase QueF [Amphritea sp. 1_MG-2023]